MVQTLTDQTLISQGLSDDKIIVNKEDANKYLHILKFRGSTTSIYDKDPKLQLQDEHMSKKFVKDLGMSMEEYMDLEHERFNQLNKKEGMSEEAPKKKKDEKAGVMKKQKNKVTFSSDTKQKSTHIVRQPRTRS